VLSQPVQPNPAFMTITDKYLCTGHLSHLPLSKRSPDGAQRAIRSSRTQRSSPGFRFASSGLRPTLHPGYLLGVIVIDDEHRGARCGRHSSASTLAGKMR
jgi:hypothetical protein